MTTLKSFVRAVNFEIGEGAEYLWGCYGPNCCQLGWVKPDGSGSAEILYDVKSHVVFELSVWDEKNSQIFRWIRPEFRKAHDRESRSRGFDPMVAIDRTRYQDVGSRAILQRLKKLHGRRNARA